MPTSMSFYRGNSAANTYSSNASQQHQHSRAAGLVLERNRELATADISYSRNLHISKRYCVVLLQQMQWCWCEILTQHSDTNAAVPLIGLALGPTKA